MSREIDAKLIVLSPNLGLTLVPTEDVASVTISSNYPKHAQANGEHIIFCMMHITCTSAYIEAVP